MKSSKSKPKPKYNGFSDFFTRASEEEKMQVFKQAARMANEEQRKLFYSKSGPSLKTN